MNPEQVGFYRVKYFSEDLERLRAPISEKALPPQDRLGIQNDCFRAEPRGADTGDRFPDDSGGVWE